MAAIYVSTLIPQFKFCVFSKLDSFAVDVYLLSWIALRWQQN